MKGFSFETFNVSEGNRAAHELCRQVAALQLTDPTPVVLLGPEQTGKSHLLWAIVKQIRSAAVKTGLALIMADEFPEKVRGLIQNPKPIQGPKGAILLVDGLEAFRENAGDLEAVVAVFQQCNRHVIIASNVHPDRLDNFSEAFKKRLSACHIMEIQAYEEADAADLAGLLKEVEDLRNERNTLREQLEESQEPRQDTEELAATVAALKAGHLAEVAALKEQCDTLTLRLEEAEMTQATHHSQLMDSQNEAETALAEQARLQGVLGAQRNKTEGLQQELDEARDDNARLIVQAEALLEVVEEKKASVRSTQEDLQHRLQQFVEEFTARSATMDAAAGDKEQLEAELADSQAMANAFKAQLEQERNQFESDLREARQQGDNADEMLEESKGQEGRLSVALDAARGRISAIELELETARKQLSFQTAEMDALRHAAATQVASAHVQAGEMEHRITELESALDVVREVGRHTGIDILACSEDLENLADSLSVMARQLAALQAVSVVKPKTTESVDEQASLFDAVPFESLPTQMNPPLGSNIISTLPGPDKAFRAVVEEAMAPDREPDENEIME
jgi:hypothetical protein